MRYKQPDHEAFTRWYQECVETTSHPTAHTILMDAYYDYHLWSRDNNLKPLCPQTFRVLLEDRFPATRIADVHLWGHRYSRLYKGLKLTTSAEGNMDWSTVVAPKELTRALALAN